jgi:hypothetical protein
MGLKAAFDAQTAAFERLSPEPLYISDVLQSVRGCCGALQCTVCRLPASGVCGSRLPVPMEACDGRKTRATQCGMACM